MREQIRFRARLSLGDWDAAAGAFRCPALAIPRASVAAVHAGGRELASSDYTVDYAAREIRLRAPMPADELSVSIALESKLTSLRTAGASGGALAIATALIAALAQYLTAVEPAKIAARTAQMQLAAQHDKQAACELALKQSAGRTGEPAAGTAPTRQPARANTTHGDGSPIVMGSGTVTIQGR